MNDPFRHLHMAPELACDFMAVFSRMEYALKSTITFAVGNEDGVAAAWTTFAKQINPEFCAVTDEVFLAAVEYILDDPPRKQVIRDGRLQFERRPVNANEPKSEQVLLLVRRIRNNLFHGGKHLPEGEVEIGRDATLVGHALTVLTHCATLHPEVRARFEY